MRTGRPLAITAEIGERIAERIASGRILLDVSNDPDLPTRETIYQQMRRDPEFADKIARARQVSAHFLAESVVEIADAANDPERAQLVRNRCEQRRWLAGKFNIAYADKGAGDMNLNISLDVLIAASMKPAENAAMTIDHDAAAQQFGDTQGAEHTIPSVVRRTTGGEGVK